MYECIVSTKMREKSQIFTIIFRIHWRLSHFIFPSLDAMFKTRFETQEISSDSKLNILILDSRLLLFQMLEKVLSHILLLLGHAFSCLLLWALSVNAAEIECICKSCLVICLSFIVLLAIKQANYVNIGQAGAVMQKLLDILGLYLPAYWLVLWADIVEEEESLFLR